MRWIIILICVLFSLNGCGQNQPVLKDTHDHAVALSDLKGKWIIVNYWATWCNTCMNELPELNQFYHNIQDKNVVMYGVSYDPMPLSNLKDTAKILGIDFPILADNPVQIWHFEDVSVVPTTFIVNPEGKVAETVVGETSEQSLASIMRVLQKEYVNNHPS